MSVTPAQWATQQDQSSGEAAAIRAMISDNSAVQGIALSGCRICEAQNAKLNEIDLVSMTWTIPAAQRKDYREHIIPITASMAELLDKAMKHASGSAKGQEDYLFVMPRLARLKALKGIPAAFRQWVTAKAELSAAERAYSRTPDTRARRYKMEAWADHLMEAKAD